MAQRRHAVRPQQQAPRLTDRLKIDAAVLAGLGSTLVAFAFQEALFTRLDANHYLTALKFVCLFGVMLWCAFNVVRHADATAALLGEPYGTLVLTLSAIVIEVALIASIMLHGANNPTLARDAMFATLMIVLNGMVGTALLIGALRYSQQDYNLEGARAFLVVIAALAVFAVVLPAYIKTAPDPSIAPGQAILLGTVTLLFYAVILLIGDRQPNPSSIRW